MLPILVAWGPIVLPSWHVAYALGAVAGFALLQYLARRVSPPLAGQDTARLFALCYIAGYFGARLLSIAIEEPEVQGLGATVAALLSFGPMTFYGGALAAFASGCVYVYRRHLPFLDVFDCSLPAGMLGLAIGRLGCFLNGDDYGKAVPLAAGTPPPFWAVVFPNLHDGIPRYPVQLLEAALAALIAGLLTWQFARLRQAASRGVIGLAAVASYGVCRFGLEFLRDDYRGVVFATGLSTSQFISLLSLAACAMGLPAWLRATGRRGS